MKTCYCCSNLFFEHCCEPYLLGLIKAPSALALMRSRYSAYCLQNVDYLVATTHSTTRKFHNKKDIFAWSTQNTWLKLEILNVTETVVEFKAYYMDNKLNSHCHHEESFFKKEDETWYYVDGQFFND
jgi:SEC-C motif-containing protein